jgi:hypothetical protein
MTNIYGKNGRAFEEAKRFFKIGEQMEFVNKFHELHFPPRYPR